MKRNWIVSTVIYVAVMLVLTSCLSPKPNPVPIPDSKTVSDPLDGAGVDGKAVKDGVHAASINVGTGAGQIVADGKTGMVQTQPKGPKADDGLYTLFGRIVTNGLSLVDQGGKLGALEARVDALNTKVEQGAAAFQAYKTATDASLAAKDKEIEVGAEQHKKDQDKIAQLESTFTSWVHGLMLAVTLAFAANIAICFWIQDFKIAVVIGIGCVVSLVSLVLMGRIYQITDDHSNQIIAGLGIVLAAVSVYFIIEVVCRGSISAALKTDPVEDVKDAIAKFAPHLLEKA